jgi:hypothetical protein
LNQVTWAYLSHGEQLPFFALLAVRHKLVSVCSINNATFCKPSKRLLAYLNDTSIDSTNKGLPKLTVLTVAPVTSTFDELYVLAGFVGACIGSLTSLTLSQHLLDALRPSSSLQTLSIICDGTPGSLERLKHFPNLRSLTCARQLSREDSTFTDKPDISLFPHIELLDMRLVRGVNTSHGHNFVTTMNGLVQAAPTLQH